MMKSFLTKNKTWLFPATFVVMLIGVGLIWLGLNQTVTVVVDGETLSVCTSALTVRGALRAAEIPITSADRVSPARGRWFWKVGLIQLETAREVVIRTPEEDLQFTSAARIPANLLQEADIALYPHDQVRLNGEIIDLNAPLDSVGDLFLQFEPATPITLVVGEEAQTFYTGEATLGAALEAAGIQIGEKDHLSEPLSTVISQPMTVTLRRAQPVTVNYQGVSMTGLTAAETVGGALLDIGLPLQNLDYSIPAEDTNVPENGTIRVVRGREDLQVMTEEIPFQSEYGGEDPDTPLDQIAVFQPGQNGIYAVRERILYEDDEEVRRFSEDNWQANEPQTEVFGYGSKIVVQTAVVEGETLEYYRKLTVWATSYKPCNDYTGVCHYGTASGIAVEKGVIAVTVDWYLAMNGQRVYVTGYGYGVIADTGGGVPGKPWIDLGYSEEQYESLHLPNAWRTIYFLTPVPDYVPVFLP